jgi:hypothetical protein
METTLTDCCVVKRSFWFFFCFRAIYYRI